MTANAQPFDPIRCPDCGAEVANFFEHIDLDCTGQYRDLVEAGLLRPRRVSLKVAIGIAAPWVAAVVLWLISAVR